MLPTCFVQLAGSADVFQTSKYRPCWCSSYLMLLVPVPHQHSHTVCVAEPARANLAALLSKLRRLAAEPTLPKLLRQQAAAQTGASLPAAQTRFTVPLWLWRTCTRNYTPCCN
jgi:hypothetical protein